MIEVLAPEPDGPLPPGPASPADVRMSVFLPTYQVARFIPDALESLLAQTLPPHEIIVVDDGSTDDLDAALAPFLDHIVLIRQENRGAANACNVGVRAATGDFVVLLDPDDRYFPERLERMAELAVARPDLDILTTDAFIEVEGEYTGRYNTATNPFETVDQRLGIIRTNFIFGLPAIRRTTLLTAGAFDESMVSVFDWECWIRLIIGGSRVGMVNEPLAAYRFRPGSLSGNRRRLLRGRINTLTRALTLDLRPAERAAAEEGIVFAQRMLALSELHTALLEGAPDVRTRAVRVVRDNRFAVSSRVKAAASLATPRVVRRFLARREEWRSSRPKAVRSARE